MEKYKVIKAGYNSIKELKLDPKGYFLFRINRKKKQVEVAFCEYAKAHWKGGFVKKNKIKAVIVGDGAEAIYNTVIRNKLVNNLNHAAYIGSEARKAETAMKLGLPYMQDSELDLTGIKKKMKKKWRLTEH